MKFYLLTTLLMALIPLHAAAQTVNQPPLACHITSDSPKIDGVLDDDCWNQSPKVTDFYNHEISTLPSEKTEAWICSDSKNIYVAFRCYDSQPEKIKAEQKTRGGGIGLDDWVGIYIDPYHDFNSPVWFRVTPRGVQVEQLQSSQGSKIEWIGDWKAAAKRLDDGYAAEMMIPFSILKYGKKQKSMGICFRREHSRTGQGWTAPDITKNHEASRYFNWEGINPPDYSTKPLILGYSMTGTGDGINERMTSGLDIKRAIGTGLTGLLTMNPDFRNIEQAIGSISFSYAERQLPDSRPFFTEGSGYFPGSVMFYSRRIEDTDLGAKLVGKQGKYSYAFMNTRTIDRDSNFVGQIGRQHGEDGGYWLAMTNADWPGLNNSVYHTSMWRRIQKSTDSQTSVNASFHRSSGPTDIAGDRINLGIDRSVSHGRLGWSVDYYDVDPNFQPVLAIGQETDYKGLSGWFGVEKRPDSGRMRDASAGIYWDLLHKHDGSVFKNGLGGYIGTDMQNGTWGTLRFITEKRGPYDDSLYNAACGWNQYDLYGNGDIQYSCGRLAGGSRSYLSVRQSFKVLDNLAFQIWFERQKIGSSSLYAGLYRQVVASLTYDLDDTQGITARFVRANGSPNLSLGFRRRVSAGYDAYIMYGDPNAERTVHSLVVKLVRPLQY